MTLLISNSAHSESETPGTSSTDLKNHVYLTGEMGHIFAYSWYPTISTPAFYANLNVSACGSPIHVTLDGIEYKQPAYVAGQVVTQLHTNGTKAVTFVFYPQNPLYRAIRLLGRPPVAPLSRSLFQQFDTQLIAASEGCLTIHDAKTLFSSVCQVLTAFLPMPRPLDKRVEAVFQLLNVDPAYPQTRLAQTVAMSSNRLSHLFTAELGIDLRRYRLALKIGRGMSVYKPGMQLTEIAQAAGFSDSQHLSKAFKELFGGSPMFFINTSSVVGVT